MFPEHLKLPLRLVVFTGAGMSAESGVDTFRTPGGIWERYRVEEVATPEAWQRDPDRVTEFYNWRRKQLMERAKPNQGHLVLAALQNHCEVDVVTQNVDDLHERAGSKKVLHLHGELRRVRSSGPSAEVFDWPVWEVRSEDRCPEGHRLRPDVVWFGEPVPNMGHAQAIAQQADVLLVIGTSLQVYPAAGLVQFVPPHCPIVILDLEHVDVVGAHVVRGPASKGLTELWKHWLPNTPLPQSTAS